jgi:predicted ThiF/HesA family dinucleotide-utilizing enzyme
MKIDHFAYWEPNRNKKASGTVSCECGWTAKASSKRVAINLLKAHRGGFNPDGIRCRLTRKE